MKRDIFRAWESIWGRKLCDLLAVFLAGLATFDISTIFGVLSEVVIFVFTGGVFGDFGRVWPGLVTFKNGKSGHKIAFTGGVFGLTGGVFTIFGQMSG